jgi:HEAT repeat protein
MQKLLPRVLLGILAFLVVVIAIRFVAKWRHIESAQELTDLALRAGSPFEQEQAATRLEALACKTPGTGTRNSTQPFLVRLLNESDNPGVRAAGMRGLTAIWDYECVPKMLDSLQDPSPQVSRTAAQSVARLISADDQFDTSAPTEKRAAAAKQLRNMWESFQARTLKSWQRRLEEKDAKK